MGYKALTYAALFNTLLWTGCTTMPLGSKQEARSVESIIQLTPLPVGFGIHIAVNSDDTKSLQLNQNLPIEGVRMSPEEFESYVVEFSRKSSIEEGFFYDEQSQTIWDVGFNEISANVDLNIELINNIIAQNNFEGCYRIIHNHPIEISPSIPKNSTNEYSSNENAKHSIENNIGDVLCNSSQSYIDVRSSCYFMKLISSQAKEAAKELNAQITNETCNGWYLTTLRVNEITQSPEEISRVYQEWKNLHFNNFQGHHFQTPEAAIIYSNRAAQSLLNLTSGTLDLDYHWVGGDALK